MKTLVLTYHNVVSSDKDLHLYDVSLDAFKKQMMLLRSQGHKVTTSQGHLPSDPEAQRPSAPATQRPSGQDTRSPGLSANRYPLSANLRDTILTFDDGYKSWAGRILDILLSLEMKAYFFVCIEFIENGFISKNDIIKLKNKGMIIGSHGMKHRFLHLLDEEEIYFELHKSKQIIEEILEDEVKFFSLPRGIYNQKVIRISREVGYEKVFTSDIGLSNSTDYILKRIPIKRNTRLSDFQNIIRGKGIRKMTFSQRIKDAGKKILGIRWYNRLREALVPGAE